MSDCVLRFDLSPAREAESPAQQKFQCLETIIRSLTSRIRVRMASATGGATRLPIVQLIQFKFRSELIRSAANIEIIERFGRAHSRLSPASAAVSLSPERKSRCGRSATKLNRQTLACLYILLYLTLYLRHSPSLPRYFPIRKLNREPRISISINLFQKRSFNFHFLFSFRKRRQKHAHTVSK